MNIYTKKVIQLSLPMAITQLITLGSIFLCMAMLAKLGPQVLAASVFNFSIGMTLLIAPISLLFALSILIGHHFGAEEHEEIGNLVQFGWVLSFFISIPILIIYWYIYPILIFFGQDKIVSKIVEEYFHSSIFRIIPFLLSVCNQQFCYGVHKPKIDVFANILGMIVLLVFSYSLIFGKFGFPAFGVAGFGYASTLQTCVYFIFTLASFYFFPYFNKFEIFRMQLRSGWNSLKQIFTTGWAISLQITGEMVSFLVATLLIGLLGVTALAAYQIIMQYQFLVVIPIFAISQASGILIGQAYGKKQFDDIQKIGSASLRITVIISIVTGIIFILFPKVLASLYINVNDPANAQILHLTLILFVILAFSQFFDAIRNVVTGTLRGLLDTRYPMVIGLASIWLISLPLGYLFAFPLDYGVIGMVSGWICGMIVGAIIIYYRWSILSSNINMMNVEKK